MLLLVTIGLVLIGAVALVIGFVSNSLGPIYLSIACSVIAGIVLVVFSRMARRQEATSTTTAPVPEPARRSWPARSAPTTDSAPQAPATAASTPQPSPAPPPPPSRPAPVSRPEPAPAPATAGVAGAGATATLTAPRPGVTGDFDFPIEGYDSLRASQVLDRLDALSLDELDMVREREEHGKNRATVLKRVDMRIEELEAREDGVGPRVGATDGDGGGFAAASGEAMDEAQDGFPISNYDSLSADEIIARLDDLDDDEVDMVAAREERGLNRVEILDYIDNMFEEIGPDDGPFAAPAPRVPSRPAAKKASVKKTSVKKAAAKKAVVRGVAAKKAPAAKAGATRAPAAKAAGRPGAITTKAPARKAAGRGVAKKAAGTGKAATPRGAAAKKAAPRKSTAKRAPAVKKR